MCSKTNSKMTTHVNCINFDILYLWTGIIFNEHDESRNWLTMRVKGEPKRQQNFM